MIARQQGNFSSAQLVTVKTMNAFFLNSCPVGSWRRAIKTCMSIVVALIALSSWASYEADSLLLDSRPKINLSGHLSVYRDSTGLVSIKDIVNPSSNLFKPINGSLSEGFTSDTVWVQFTLVGPRAEAPSIRWLELSQPLLFNASLFQKNADGQYTEVQGVLNQTLAQSEPGHRKTVFEIRIDNANPQSFYLRLNAPSSISSELILWKPDQFATYNSIQLFLWGAIYGAYAIMILFYSGFYFWTRDRIHMLYAVYITVQCMSSFYSGTWPLLFVPDLSSDVFFRTLGVALCLTLPIAMIFSFLYLNLKGKWRIFSNGVIGIATVSSIFASDWCLLTNMWWQCLFFKALS